jgi:hypothetical protein
MQQPGSSIKTYFDRMQAGDRALGESLRAFSTVLERHNQAVDIKATSDKVDQGLSGVRSIPQIDARADSYRDRLIELLAKQKRIVDGFASANPKDWKTTEAEEESLILEHNKFVSEYDEWLPGFMKEHGYEVTKGNDH